MLIFGVDDNDNIVGLTNMKKDSEDISEIINAIKNIPNITVSEIAKQLNYIIDSVQHYINKLKDEGLIVHKGSTKAGYWEVKED